MYRAPDWLQRRAMISPNKVAIVDTIKGSSYTYKDWNEQANRTARFLQEALEVGVGDRIAILATNCSEYLDLIFAANKLGAIVQHLNFRLAAAEIAKLLEHGQPKVLIYSADLIDAIRELQQTKRVYPDFYIAISEQSSSSDVELSLRESHDSADLPCRVSPRSPWMICYTGGTTGLPKGVIQSYRNVAANAISTSVTWNLLDTDKALLNAPLCHSSGLHVLTTPLVHAGGTSVLCSGVNVDQMFDLIENKDINVLFAVPTVFILMQQHERWKATDFSHIRLAFTGGSPCPQEVFERFFEKDVDFFIGYGLTEAGPNNFVLPPHLVREKKGSVGYPGFYIQTKLVNEDDEEIHKAGEVGEILIRGAHRTDGYWANPVATSKCIDVDGWLHTGDLASVDEDGCYWVNGRASDMFISGGENVYPSEVESALYRHPDVLEACVFGVADKMWGEVGCAVIAVSQGKELSEADLLGFLGELLGKFKIPRHYFFVDRLPKTGPGKIDRRIIQQSIEITSERAE